MAEVYSELDEKSLRQLFLEVHFCCVSVFPTGKKALQMGCHQQSAASPFCFTAVFFDFRQVVRLLPDARDVAIQHLYDQRSDLSLRRTVSVDNLVSEVSGLLCTACFRSS